MTDDEGILDRIKRTELKEGDPGTWSHCGSRTPHHPHLHTIVFNEGPYHDVKCNGTPGEHPSYVDPVYDPAMPLGRAWQKFYRPGMGSREAESFKAGFAAALGLTVAQLEQSRERIRRGSFTHAPVHLWDVQQLPWTTACGIRFHSEEGERAKISATTNAEDATCRKCLGLSQPDEGQQEGQSGQSEAEGDEVDPTGGEAEGGDTPADDRGEPQNHENDGHGDQPT